MCMGCVLIRCGKMTELETATLKEEFLTHSSREEGCTTLHGAHEERQGLSAGRG